MDKMTKDKQKEREKEREKEEGKGGVFGLSLPDRNSSEERRGSGRKSLDALTENFKRKSLESRRSDKSSSSKQKDGESGGRKEKEKVGSFDPAAGVSGLGSVAEADHEPYHHRQEEAGDEKKMKIPGAFEE